MSDTKIDRTLGSGQQWCFPLSFLGGRAGVMNVGPRGICSQRDHPSTFYLYEGPTSGQGIIRRQ